MYTTGQSNLFGGGSTFFIIPRLCKDNGCTTTQIDMRAADALCVTACNLPVCRRTPGGQARASNIATMGPVAVGHVVTTVQPLADVDGDPISLVDHPAVTIGGHDLWRQVTVTK
jgi:hypothetical protein